VKLISDATRTSKSHQEKLEDEEEEIVSTKDPELSSAEKVDLWKIEKPDVIRQENEPLPFDETDPAAHEDQEDYVITHYPEAWTFLTNSNAYEWLLARMKAEILLTKIDGTLVDSIKKEILKGLASISKRFGYHQGASQARFEISWPLMRYIEEKYLDKHDLQLGSLITIVGSGGEVQALTCSQYMNQVWPVTGLETLLALQGALDKGAGQTYKGVYRSHLES
jgi:hypothetical protein